MIKPQIVVVSGLGNCTGTGGETARLFAREGFRVALVSRPRREVDELKAEINQNGGQAEVFSLNEYDYDSITEVFEKIQNVWKDARIKCCVWNTAQWSNIPFLDITKEDIERSVRINIVAATAFSQSAVKAFLAEGSEEEKGGTLIMTGATSALRGKEGFGAFAAGKHGLRALSQSIAREYNSQGVHVAFVIVDGTILTTRTSKLFASRPDKSSNWLHDEKQRLSPSSIAKTYLWLHRQTPDCWTLELDLRPAKEKF
ncbi:uncharacterized protein JCM6883_002454 [Sporobolomyces salmoneus]|uniref:uncharacterized protein n=1 Tax=Sporobolomyces salmoneus TaxID=183962 RepID=UPI00317BC925